MRTVSRLKATASIVPGMADRQKADRGAGLAEYAALIVLAALILGGLVALGLPSQVRTGVSGGLCRIFHLGSSTGCGSTGTRADPYKPTQPCTVSSSSTRYGGDIAFASVDIGGGVTLLEQKDSQGHVTVTAVEDNDYSVAAGAGVGYQWGKSVNIGADASASGGITIRTGDSWTFNSQKDADKFTGDIKERAYAEEAGEAGGGFDELAVYGWEHTPLAPKIPPPDVTRVSVATNASGSGDAGIHTGKGKEPKPAGKHQPGKHAAPSKSGKTDGTKSTEPDIGQANAQVSYSPQATKAVDHKNHTTSYTVDVTASGTVNGDVAGHGVQPNNPVGWTGNGAVKVTLDSHGNVTAVDLTQTTTTNGKTTVTTSHLPVNDSNRQRVVKDLALDGAKPPLPYHLLWSDLAPTEDPGKAGNDFQREMYQHAQTTKVTYDTSSSDTPVAVEAKLGLEFQLGADYSTSDQKVTSAQYLGPPGPDGKRHYQQWKECK